MTLSSCTDEHGPPAGAVLRHKQYNFDQSHRVLYNRRVRAFLLESLKSIV